MPEMLETLKSLIQPWHKALESPQQAQEETLRRLLGIYARTEYGAKRRAGEISSIEEYRQAFPVMTYPDYKPIIEQVMEGEYQMLLSEPPLGWAITRGTTGQFKFIPMTGIDMEYRGRCGARGVLNYVLRTGRYHILEGCCMNQTFPSVAGSMTVGDKEITYGYSSGLYARYSEARTPVQLVPRQDELDAIGAGLSAQDWERRFELIYQRARGASVTMLVGVTQTMLQFGLFLKKRYGIYPKDVWQMDPLSPSSIAGIQYKYKPALKALYGDVDIVEIYGATEGSFAQQLDERPYVTPNYDVFFFEVETGKGIKMLHSLRPGEYGSLIVSTPTLPRYRIEDLILSFGNNCFRCIGREKPFAYLRYKLDTMWNWDPWQD
ncbi:MAG: GH3 auxin-responsive promoter family protein [Anaerolineae bacterium]